MLLLLVQGKLTNLKVEELFAFNVFLQMFTRSIVIQRRVKDLQLGVESYQKKLNLTRPDTYRSNLKHKEAYSAYSNPRGFIYQNKDKQNRLMRIDELHKFSDGMLTDVRTALDDRLKGIRMKYLPQTIWRKSDKDRVAAMIQANDKQLKTKRIMRSLERSILTDLQVTPTKPERMTKPYSSHRFIANCFNAGNLKMEVKRVETFDETIIDDVSNQGRMIAEMDQDADVVLEDDKEEDESEPAKVQEVVDVVTTAKIITKVVTATSETITAIEEEERRALKRLNETLAEKAAKRQNLDEEVEELKNIFRLCLMKMMMFIQKLPHLLEREDLEALWSLVKEIFSTTKPKNFSDDFLLVTLGIITFTTTQLILLVEKKYPLTRFTLDQMLNAVRLEVEEESEVSLELLSTNTQNMAFVSSASNNSNSSNGVNTAQGVNTANGVNTASSQVNDASSLNIDNLSGAVIYSFLASHPNSSHLVNEEGTTNYALMAYSISSASSSDSESNPQEHLQDKGVIDSGCSRHMIGNMSFLTDYEEIDKGYVAFGGNPKGGKNTGKGKIKTRKLDFENVYFVRELKFNLFSVSQICDKKNSVLFTDTECIVLSSDFKLIDENKILLRVFRQNNMYNINLKNIVPTGGLTCLFAKATEDESKLWHKRLGHLNFKTINKLVKENLVRGLASKIFKNDQSCVACQKGKQYRASCKTKVENSISTPLHLLHMDLFRPTFVKSLHKKMYYLVVTDDYSRFTWVFFLGTKDETSSTLKSFITMVENLMNLRVKVIRCDNGTKFKNREMNQFYEVKGIMRQYSVARTPQQNGVTEMRNKTLIEAARTMLADSKLPTTFWAEAVNTACYVQNSVLVTKPHNMTLYELFHGRTPVISFLRPFGCPDTILNTIYHLGKFDGKADECFFVGYSLNSKAFRVFNSRTRIMEENLHVRFNENTPNNVGTKASNGAGKEKEPEKDYILLPLWTADLPFSTTSKSSQDNEFQPSNNGENKVDEDLKKENKCNDQWEEDSTNSTNRVNTVTSNINAASSNSHDDEDVFDAEADFHNLDSTFQVSHISTIKIHKDHPLEQVIGDLNSAPQTRRMTKNLEEHGLVGTVIPRTYHKDLEYLFVSYLNWNPRRNKMDERGIVIKNKARLVAQGHTHEKGIDYDEVFAPIARIEAIRLFLAYASFKDFIVYQMDVKSAFLYGKIEEEGQIDKTLFIKRNKDDILLVQVYVDDIIFKSTKKEMCDAFEILIHEKFQMSSMGELTFFLGLQVKQKKECIFISQDKYIAEILKNFRFLDVKKASTPMETLKPLLKDEVGEEVDIHMYRSMIGSLMYLTSSRPDIMFDICACARYQITPKVSYLHDVKRIFRYLKGQPKLGLWCPNDSPFELVAYTDSDYAGASLDRRSTTGGCQFLALLDEKNVIVNEASIRHDLKLNDAEDTPIPDEPSSSQPQRKYKPRRKKRMETKVSPTEINTEDHIPTSSNDPLPSSEDRLQLKELMKLCTNLSTKVLDLENEVIEMKSSHKAKIKELENRVEKLEEENKSLTKELKSFNTRVESPTIKETVMDKEESSKQGRKIADIDFDAEVNLENMYNLDMAHEETVLSMQDVDVQSERIEDVVKDVEDVVATAENFEGINAATIQQISKDDITLAQTLIKIKVAKPKAKVITMQEPSEFKTTLPLQSSLPSQAKDKEVARRLEAEWNADMKDNIDWNEVVEQVQSRQSDVDNAKKQKLEEQEEAEELKKNLEIVPDDEDDVFVNVTPLSSKPPTIIDYKIYKEGKKKHFQIFRANVSAVSAKSYCCQFKLMLLEEGLLLLEDLMLLIQETSKEIKITARKHKPRRKQRIETEVSPTKTNTEDHVPTPFNDPLQSGKDRMQLKELMELCTNLSNKVLDLANEVTEMKSSHKAKIEELESKVEKLEENMSLTKELTSFNTMVESLIIKETVMDKEESSKQGRKIADIDADAEVNLEIKDVVKDVEDVVAAAENVEGVTMQDPSEFKTTLPSQSSLPSHDKDKGKGLMVEPKMPLTRKDQIALDEEVARGLEAEWNTDMKDNIDWNEVVKQDQSRQSDAIKTIFEMEYNKVQAYLNKGPEMDAERIKAPRKRTRKEKVEKDQPVKKQKVPDDEDDVFLNVTPLSSKPLTNVDYKIYKEGKKEHFQIFRANGYHQMYLAFSIMLKNFDREDLEVLWKIVKDRFKKSQPMEVLDVLLWHTLKVIFEHTIEDNV
nr:hypothetical protein [Tanacetum cinerariifolium]